MATVDEVSDLLAGTMRNMAPRGRGVCSQCWAFHDPDYATCISCNRRPDLLDAFLPITYAPHGGQLYRALRDYKNMDEPRSVRRHHAIGLAAILWRFLAVHEPHLAAAAGVPEFDLVTTPPSKTLERDEKRSGFRKIVGEWVGATKGRYARVLDPNDPPILSRSYEPSRYIANTPLDGKRVLVIDDTWVSGGAVQSAAQALRNAGASHVAAVAVGRYLRLDFGNGTDWDTKSRYNALPKRFDWETCALDP